MTAYKKHNHFKSAASWQVGECECPDGHTAVLLFDEKNRLFAEAVIGEEEDVNCLVFALLGGCPSCMIERLEGLLSTVKGDLTSAKSAESEEAAKKA